MKKESHSEKGLKTIELMNTKPDDWGLTPIKWVWEIVMANVEKECPTCRGRGKAYVNIKTGKPSSGANDYKKLNDRSPSGWRSKNEYGRCPTCPQRSTRGFGPIELGTGKIVVQEKAKILVGYPIWPKGVQFDSRFEDAIYNTRRTKEIVHYVCALCSKSIGGRWSYVIPVNARGSDGKIHGMYVGEDCARKFLGLELVLDMEQLEEVKKSERKQHVQIRIVKDSK